MSEQKLGYMAEVDAWLTAVLVGGEEGETSEQWLARVKTEIKKKLLESYRNGQAAIQTKTKMVHPAFEWVTPTCCDGKLRAAEFVPSKRRLSRILQRLHRLRFLLRHRKAPMPHGGLFVAFELWEERWKQAGEGLLHLRSLHPLSPFACLLEVLSSDHPVERSPR